MALKVDNRVIAAGVTGILAVAFPMVLAGSIATMAAIAMGVISAGFWVWSGVDKKQDTEQNKSDAKVKEKEVEKGLEKELEKDGVEGEEKSSSKYKFNPVIMAAGIAGALAAIGAAFGGLAALLMVGGVGLASGVLWGVSAIEKKFTPAKQTPKQDLDVVAQGLGVVRERQSFVNSDLPTDEELESGKAKGETKTSINKPVMAAAVTAVIAAAGAFFGGVLGFALAGGVGILSNVIWTASGVSNDKSNITTDYEQEKPKGVSKQQTLYQEKGLVRSSSLRSVDSVEVDYEEQSKTMSKPETLYEQNSADLTSHDRAHDYARILEDAGVERTSLKGSKVSNTETVDAATTHMSEEARNRRTEQQID